MSAAPPGVYRSDDLSVYLQSKPRPKEWLPDLPGLHKLSRTEIMDDFEAIQSEIIHHNEQAQKEQIQGWYDAAAINQQTKRGDKEREKDREGGDREKDKKDKDKKGNLTKKPPTSSSSSSSSSSTVVPSLGGGGGSFTTSTGAVKNEGLSSSLQPSGQQQQQGATGDPNGLNGLSSMYPDGHPSLPPSRRSRLLAKLLNSSRSLDSSRYSATQLRLELEAIRNDVVQYEDAINSAKREIEMAKRERSQLETSYNLLREEYRASIENVETTRLDQEKTENELRQRLTRCSQENADLSERIHQLRQLEDEFKNKEWKIENLQIELTQAQRHIQILEAITRQKAEEGAAQQQQQQAQGGANPAATNAPIATPATQENIQSLLSSIATTELVPDLQRLLTTCPDLFQLIAQFVHNLSRVEKEAILCREKYADSQIKVHEQTRDLQQQQIQLDRMNKQQMELHHLIRHAEVAVLDERAKLEHTLKHTQLLQKQKEDQTIVLNGYEERMKHFQQLLTAADVRADQANSFLSDLQRQLHVYRNGNKQLQGLVNRQTHEMKTLTRERNEAIDDLNEKLIKNMSQEQLATYWGVTAGNHRDHYAKLSATNGKLMEEKAQLLNKITKLEDQLKTSVTRDHMEGETTKLLKKFDDFTGEYQQMREQVGTQDRDIKEYTIIIKEKEEMIKHVQQEVQDKVKYIQSIQYQWEQKEKQLNEDRELLMLAQNSLIKQQQQQQQGGGVGVIQGGIVIGTPAMGINMGGMGMGGGEDGNGDNGDMHGGYNKKRKGNFDGHDNINNNNTNTNQTHHDGGSNTGGPIPAGVLLSEGSSNKYQKMDNEGGISHGGVTSGSPNSMESSIHSNGGDDTGVKEEMGR